MREPRWPCHGSGSPGRCLLSTDAQIASPRGSPFPVSTPLPRSSPLTLPQGHPTEEARLPGLQSWGSHSRSRQPPEQGPNALGEVQLQRPGVGGGEPPSSPARSIPGHCCHQRTCPTLPSALPAWPRARAASSGFGARPGSGRSLSLAAVAPLPRISVFPSRQRGAGGGGGQSSSPRHFQVNLSSFCGVARTGSPQGSPPPHPFPAWLLRRAPSPCPRRQAIGALGWPPPLAPCRGP